MVKFLGNLHKKKKYLVNVWSPVEITACFTSVISAIFSECIHCPLIMSKESCKPIITSIEHLEGGGLKYFDANVKPHR